MKSFREFLNEKRSEADILKMLDREYGKGGKVRHKDFVSNITFLGTEDGVDWYAMGIDDAWNAKTEVYMAKVYDNGKKIKLNDYPYTTIRTDDIDSVDSLVKAAIKKLSYKF